MTVQTQIPLATYRLQFNRDFTFNQATGIVPYLAAVGISHCYASPCLKARSGSMHGYDIVDHNSLNPEIGTPEDFDRFVDTLHRHNMGLILDIVPNHMAVMGDDNVWWLDVLENSESSIYAGFFDIDWHPLKEELQGKVLIPVLHDHYGAVLESGELKLVFHQQRGEFDIHYRTHRFPIDPKEYPRVLQSASEKLASKPGEQSAEVLEFQSLLTAFRNLPDRRGISPSGITERNRDKEIHKRRLAQLCERAPEVAEAISEAVIAMNGTPDDFASFENLHELIKAQTFRLANWRVASDDINYRRFFDTNDLAGICVEKEEVFQATHKFVLSLIEERKIDGLRIDHPDGLYDPRAYFNRLSQSLVDATSEPHGDNQPPRYVVIEKILTGAERLPHDWPVFGTTGYDFSNLVNGLFVNPASARRMHRIYSNYIDEEIDVEDLAYRSRRLITRVSLASELSVLANQLTRIALAKRRTCDFTLNSLRDALTQIAASFPVYRTYVSCRGVSDDDVRFIRTAIVLAKQRSPAADTSIFDFIAEVLLTSMAEGQDAVYRRNVTNFAMKFQQFTSPVMAKGLEDTAFYRFNRLVSLNEVGGDLRRFGTTLPEFHRTNQARLRDWPHSMLSSSTHDSKRSEDVRARINVLSEIPELWNNRVREWRRLNLLHKQTVNDQPAPSRNDEYLLYQTLLGAWPLQPLSEETEWSMFRDRINSYMLKAIREAKQNTSWINQNLEYEHAMSSFVEILLKPGDENRFLREFLSFQQRIAFLGIWNSLSQTLLKLTSPGVPDIYQGNDLWDLSLVDPDNRRQVDYALRQKMFDGIQPWGSNPNPSLVAPLLENPNDGRLKLFLTWRTLCFRQQNSQLFQQGEYQSVSAEGTKANYVVAFTRKLGPATVLVVAPRLISGLLEENQQPPIGSPLWSETRLNLSRLAPHTRFTNIFTGETLSIDQAGGRQGLELSTIFSAFPVALFFAREAD
jgi:(1->4)-alpha-D-glucan 1-alpha-D-glucosylmutase